MGSFIGALLIGKVRGSWVPTSFPFICQPFLFQILSSPCLFRSFTFCAGSEHKKSHTAFPMEMQLVHHKVNLMHIFGILESESSTKDIWRNLRNIFRWGFQTWRLPWRRVNMTLLQFFQFSTRYSFVHWQVSVSEYSVPNNLIIFFFSGWPAQLWSAYSWSVKHQPANQPNPGHTECHSWYLCYMQSLNHAMSSKS